MSEKTVIEIDGVKMEVDLRHAKRIDTLRVGDRVKVLRKVYDGHKVYAGIVIGFELFKELPTIIIAYVELDWSSVDIKFLYFNKETKDSEIVAAIDNDQLDLDRTKVLAAINRKTAELESQLNDVEAKRAYFLETFAQYWAPITMKEKTDA